MTSGGRRRSVAFFIAFGACLTAGAVALYIGWVIVSWRAAGMLILGVIVFPLIITGVVLNTIFLVREIRRNDRHDAFLNAVTHELKTPVASIRLYLQTLQSRDVDAAKRQEFYGVMIEDADRLMSTIEQVLRAGRVGARVRHAAHAPVDLSRIVRDCLDLARTRHHLPETALSYREALLNGSSPKLLGDEDELKAAVLNLVDNAVKYSRPDVRVSVELEQREMAQARLRVQDWGAGIATGELKRIFRRFYRSPGAIAVRVKGTGLGLFIVRSVIKRHGGKVFAESEGPGRGSIFTVELPLLPPQ